MVWCVGENEAENLKERMRQTPYMEPRKKELKLDCITASNQEPLRLPKLLLLSWHPQEAGHMGCYREARVMTSCCGSLVRLKDIAQNSLCYVVLVGRLGKRSGAGTTKKLWDLGNLRFGTCCPLSSFVGSMTSLATAPAPHGSSFNFPTPWARCAFSTARKGLLLEGPILPRSEARRARRTRTRVNFSCSSDLWVPSCSCCFSLYVHLPFPRDCLPSSHSGITIKSL